MDHPRSVPAYIKDALGLGKSLSLLGKAVLEGIRGYAEAHNIQIEGLPAGCASIIRRDTRSSLGPRPRRPNHHPIELRDDSSAVHVLDSTAVWSPLWDCRIKITRDSPSTAGLAYGSGQQMPLRTPPRARGPRLRRRPAVGRTGDAAAASPRTLRW